MRSLWSCDAQASKTRFTHWSTSVILRHHAEGTPRRELLHPARKQDLQSRTRASAQRSLPSCKGPGCLPLRSSQSKTSAPACPSNQASSKAVRCFFPTGRDGCPTLKPSCSRSQTHATMIRSTPLAKRWPTGVRLMDGMRIRLRTFTSSSTRLAGRTGSVDLHLPDFSPAHGSLIIPMLEVAVPAKGFTISSTSLRRD